MSLINLEKKARITLEKKGILDEKINVVLAIDYSASMGSLYSKGIVSKIVEKLLAIGLNVDIDKSIDVYAFGNSSIPFGSVTSKNYQGFVENEMLANNSLQNTTNYAPVIKDISTDIFGSNVLNQFEPSVSVPKENKGFFKRLFSKEKEVATPIKHPVTPAIDVTVPTLVFFITDGENFDESKTRNVMQSVSPYPIFWQFVGIGNQSFRFLRELDEKLPNRAVDNANFFQLNDIENIPTEELYDRILNEFPEWLIESRRLGITPPKA